MATATTTTTTWETKEADLYYSTSDTITGFALDEIMEPSWIKSKALSDVDIEFPHPKANVTVLFKPPSSYYYLKEENGSNFDLLGTIGMQGVTESRKWVYTVDDVVIKSVIDTFKQADKVDSIYGHNESGTFSFLVFINVPKYDDYLAEQLATYAIELEDRFNWATFEYHYVPVSVGYNSFITERDKCHYKRNEP